MAVHRGAARARHRVVAPERDPRNPPAVRDGAPDPGDFRRDVLRGLSSPIRSLPCKYLYDRTGAELFERITRLDEYYLTRVEWSILCEHVDEMAARLGPRCMVVEFGSGAAVKTALLLERLEDPVAYVPIDVARDQLEAVAAQLAERFPGLEILPVHGDYTRTLTLPRPRREPRRTVVFFPGSTIGNFEPDAAAAFLARAAKLCGPGGALLVGVDRVKDRDTLERAYDDPEGVTAAFDRNILVRMRRELGVEVDPDAFEHRAVYDEGANRIEMHLVSRRPQVIHVPVPGEPDRAFHFEEGDVIVTEHSYKYTVPGFSTLAEAAGLRIGEVWSDPEDRFSVYNLEVPA